MIRCSHQRQLKFDPPLELIGFLGAKEAWSQFVMRMINGELKLHLPLQKGTATLTGVLP